MSQTTKFYLPFFTTGYPFGKLYTYITGTSTPAPTYKDTTGTLNTNPVVMDSKGNCILYIDQDITYRYVLYDQNNNLIYDNNGIKQLNGDPGTPGGPKGPTGDIGRTGNQGSSGSQGITGDKGPTGDQGAPFLTRIPCIGNTTLTIPQGIDSIYVTAVGGGGAGASWSSYIFLQKQIDTTRTPFQINPLYKVVSSGATGVAQTGAVYSYIRLQGLIFMPGSGMSGQSVFRQKISLDKTQANTVQIFIGTGGTNDTTFLNGTSGTNTQIFVNGAKVLDLNGGLGGKNYFPKNSSQVPTLPTDGTPIRLNTGYHTGLIIVQNNYPENFNTPPQGAMPFSWNTTYPQRQSSGGFTNVAIQLSYNAPMGAISKQYMNISSQMYTTSNIKDLTGGGSIFGNYYTLYPPKDEWLSYSSKHGKNGIKGGEYNYGWGAGGDVFYNQTSWQSAFQNYFLQGQFTSDNGANLIDFNADYVKTAIINYCINFTVSDSFSPGVADIPLKTDTSGFWNGVSNIQSLINSDTVNNQQVDKSGFYNNCCQSIYANDPNFLGGQGVNGYALIEYGNITDVPKPSN